MLASKRFSPRRSTQFVAELAESKSGLVVAETRSGEAGEPDIGDTGDIAVAAFEAETDRLAGRQGSQVRVCKTGRRRELSQNLDGCEGCRVLHQRQIDEILDCPAPKQ